MATPPSPDYSMLDTPDVCNVLFHPRKSAGPVEENSHFVELLIPVADGIQIGSRFYLTDQHSPLLLFFHGNGEIVADYDDIAPLFNRLGVNFVVVDYRGYGCSTGQPTVSAMMADSHCILDFVERWKTKEGYSGPLIVMGRSLGSASALELAASGADRIDGLIIESGFAWEGPLLALLGVNPTRIGFEKANGFANIDKIRRYLKPTLIIHAEFDHIIPYKDGEALYEASGAKDKSLLKIPGANHNDIFFRGLELYMEAILTLAAKLK
jgi:pimeloyl-ACP methyl ester carboxylesterase